MSEEKIYKTLAEFLSYEEKWFGDVLKYEVQYKQPNYSDPGKVWKHQAKDSDISESALKLLTSASAGERLCFHVGKEGNFPAIRDITDAKDAEKKQYSGNAKYNNNKEYKPKDETGVAVGAAYKDVKENMALLDKKPTFKSMDEVREFVKEEARKVLKDKMDLEAEVRATKKAADPDKEKQEEKPKSRAQLMKEKQESESKKEVKEPEKRAKPKKDPDPVEEDDIEEADDIEADDLDDVV